MEESSEEQVISRLFDLENDGQAAHFQHGLDETEGAEVPPGTEFWQYSTLDEAARAYAQLLQEDRQAGELVETDSEEGLGDSDTDGAEVRDRYSASDEDLLIGGEDEDKVGQQTD